MRNNSYNITYAYHFLNEAIIIFLMALPFLYYHYFWVPYVSYLIITVALCIVFTVITRLTTSYFWYIMMAPVLFIVFYMLGYPILMGILFACIFIWRYIDIRKEEIINRENTYILLTLILTAFVVLLIDDSRIMLYPFFQFIILIFGYIISNLAVVKKENWKHFDKKIPFYFIGLLAMSAGIFYLLFSYARIAVLMAWDVLIALITESLTGVSKLLSFIKVEEMEWQDQENEIDGGEGNEYWNKLEEFNVVDTITNYWAIAISLLILSIVLFFVLILAMKRFRGKIDQIEVDDDSVTYNAINPTAKQSNRSILSGLNKYFNKPTHPIRKMVYQFEKKTTNTKKGRKSSETFKEWIARNGWKVDLYIYEKVRYGNQDVSDRDVTLLKQQLKEIEAEL